MGMRTLSRYEDFDRDAEMTSEALVVNVSPFVARFEIGASAGSPPRRYRLDPEGTVHIQAGYTRPFAGASPTKLVRPTIESLTERQVRPGGPSLPCVVHKDRADEVRRQWQEALAKVAEPPKPITVTMQPADGSEPIEMTVQPAAPPPAPVLVGDDEDQLGGELDEPPPEHNDPIDAVTVPAAPTSSDTTTKPAKGSRGR